MTALACAGVRCAFALLLVACAAFGERLPIRAYNTADGLPSDGINAITRDSRGFLWFATDEGLARFNGYEFSTYGRANGLPRDSIADFLETRSGAYWAATSDGLAKFESDGPAAKKFTVYRPPTPDGRHIHVLFEDRRSRLWCGTDAGLFRLVAPETPGDEWRFEAVSLLAGRDQRVISMLKTAAGTSG